VPDRGDLRHRLCALFNRDSFWVRAAVILLWWASLWLHGHQLAARGGCRAAAFDDGSHASALDRAAHVAASSPPFVTAEDHWLPTRQFSGDPKPSVAHPTSPTNFGLGLLAIVSGAISAGLACHVMPTGWIRSLDTLLALRAIADISSTGTRRPDRVGSIRNISPSVVAAI